MGKLEPSSNFLPPDKAPSNAKRWGLVISPPIHKNIKIIDENAKKCPKCGSFLCTSNDLCPICTDDVSNEVNREFYEEFKIVPKDFAPKKRLIAFVIDLSIPGIILNQIIHSLMFDSNFSQYKNYFFTVTIIANRPIYICKKKGFIHMQCGYIKEKSIQYEFEASEVPDIIEQVFLLISSGGFHALKKSSVIVDVFRVLSSFGVDIAFLFYNLPLPFVEELSFSVHCIYVSTDTAQSMSSNLRAYGNKWTNITIKQVKSNLSTYIANILNENVPLKSTTKLSLSNGLQFDSISIPFMQTTKKMSRCCISNARLSCYGSIFATISFTSSYKLHNQFRIQVSHELDDGAIYVENVVFQKTNDIQEYIESFNFSAYIKILMRQYSNAYFTNIIKPTFFGLFDKKTVWNINSLFGSLILQKYARVAYKRFLSIISESSPLENATKENILFYIASFGSMYLSDLINSLLATPGEYEFINIPPYIFCKKLPNEMPKDVINSLHGGIITIYEEVTPQTFDFLQNLFREEL